MCIACTSSAVSTISTISTRCSSAATARPAPPPPPTATTTTHRHHRHPPPPHTPPHTTTHHLHLSQCAPCAPPRQTHRDDVEPMPAGAKVGGERLAVQAHRHHLAERLQRKGHREEPPTGGQGSRRLGRRPHADGRAQSEGSAYPGGPAKTAADSAEAQAAAKAPPLATPASPRGITFTRWSYSAVNTHSGSSRLSGSCATTRHTSITTRIGASRALRGAGRRGRPGLLVRRLTLLAMTTQLATMSTSTVLSNHGLHTRGGRELGGCSCPALHPRQHRQAGTHTQVQPRANRRRRTLL